MPTSPRPTETERMASPFYEAWTIYFNCSQCEFKSHSLYEWVAHLIDCPSLHPAFMTTR